MRYNVLLVEDNPSFVSLIEYLFEQEGSYRLDVASSEEDGYRKLTERGYDLIIMNIWIGGERVGLELLRALRSRTLRVPVLILSACDQESTIIEGLAAGADDYLAKPFGVREFLARTSNLLTRAGNFKRLKQDSNGEAGGVIVRPELPAIEITGETAPLRPKEYELFLNLASQPGTIVSREHLIRKVWGNDYSGGQSTVDVHISTLRRRLERFKEKIRIESIRGKGYRYVCNGSWCQLRSESS
ncbi:response regulator transcription factor [Paenibacillus sp. 1P07SE]|uniref:response regulator transcription factor n=1 Tax=Paenibacillus sp. 1P07SE TaxID=3132209 RepID=UPI0039A68342